jgi:hypothetical protein
MRAWQRRSLIDWPAEMGDWFNRAWMRAVCTRVNAIGHKSRRSEERK